MLLFQQVTLDSMCQFYLHSSNVLHEHLGEGMNSIFFSLKIVTIITILFLFSFPFYLPTLPQEAIKFLIQISTVRRISSLASLKGTFQARHTHRQTSMPSCQHIWLQHHEESQTIFSLMINIYIQVLIINSPSKARSIHCTFCTTLFVLGLYQVFSFSQQIILIENFQQLALFIPCPNVSLNILGY